MAILHETIDSIFKKENDTLYWQKIDRVKGLK